MPGHRSGVAEAKVDVTMPVNVEELAALRFAHKRRKCACPFHHPVHGYATQKRFASTHEQCFGFGPFVHEAFLLVLHPRSAALWVHGFHGSSSSSGGCT